MKYIDYMIGIIDKAVAEYLTGETQVMGLAQLARRIGRDDKEQMWPASYQEGGDCKYAGVDDSFDVVTYHRSLSMRTTKAKTGKYGDGVGDTSIAHQMCMVIYANKDKIGCDANDLALMLTGAFPEMLNGDDKPDNLKTVNINLGDIVLNESQVFGEEYKNVDYFLGPEHILIKLNYSIESTLDKRCFKNCP